MYIFYMKTIYFLLFFLTKVILGEHKKNNTDTVTYYRGN